MQIRMQQTAAMTKKAVLLVGHADPLSFNHQIATAYARGFSEAGGSVERIHLADLNFDPVLRKGFREPQPLEPDLIEARRAIEESSHLAWAFPTYWAAPPALVRGFFDRLFLPGWAFRYEKGKALPVGLLKGRSSRVLLTMDSPGYWYSLYYGRSVHRSFGRGSLSFCGLSPVRFSTVYDMLHKGEEARARVLLKMEKMGRGDAVSS
jgi:putative NADPH-quinone reductase